MTDLVTLRPAEERDLEYLNYYAYCEGMDSMPSAENITVAVNEDDIPVGFIRIAMGANGIAHVNPVVVLGTWRGHGVGRILTEDALAKHGELRLVSRGGSISFYRALGFTDLTWDQIDPLVVDDCGSCELRAECQPQPMGKAL